MLRFKIMSTSRRGNSKASRIAKCIGQLKEMTPTYIPQLKMMLITQERATFFQQEAIIKALLTSPFSQYVAMASQIHWGIGLF